MSVRICPRGMFTARSARGHEMRIHTYAVFDQTRSPIVEVHLKTEFGGDIQYAGKGRYVTFDGTEYACDDPEAP